MTSNESPEANPAPRGPDDSAQIKRKLAWRMGVAGAMIVALLGGLALFDRLAVGPEETEPTPPRFTEPVPVPKKSVTQALGPVVPAPDEGTEKPGASVPESTAAPTGRPGAASSPSPGAAAHPASRQPGRSSPRSTPAVPLTPPAGQAEQKGAQAAGGTALPRQDAPEADAAHALASPRQPVTFSKPLSGYTLQAGVFADPRRAEEIHARLVQEGIPATLETRVLVGPFRNRGEADSARARMTVMGIDASLLPRSAKK